MSVYKGAKLVFTRRKLIWLWGGYAVALYAHRYILLPAVTDLPRYLENAIAPALGKNVYKVSAYSQIFVGFSNLGELFGAFCVFMASNFIKTPLPWLRMDAILLMLVWYLPFYKPERTGEVSFAWQLGPLFIPISFGWAAGDVSLAAYIQAVLAREEGKEVNISPLGAVMSFLYSSYIVLYAALGTVLGRVIDSSFAEDGDMKRALIYIAGIHFTCISVFVLCNTLIPKGAIAFNPDMLYDENLEKDLLTEKGPQAGDQNEQTGKAKLDASGFLVT